MISWKCLSRLRKFRHWESEIGVREGLVLQCEVPPLAVQRLEAVAQHRGAQDHAVAELLRRDVPVS